MKARTQHHRPYLDYLLTHRFLLVVQPDMFVPPHGEVEAAVLKLKLEANPIDSNESTKSIW
jgi:hypothetical protein